MRNAADASHPDPRSSGPLSGDKATPHGRASLQRRAHDVAPRDRSDRRPDTQSAGFHLRVAPGACTGGTVLPTTGSGRSSSLLPVTQPSALAGILAAAARRMRADFDESGFIEHRGAKGSVREEVLLDFLKKYLPDNVRAAGSAEIISTDGQRSGQMDVVIYDPGAPSLFDRGNHRILPAECVYAVIEVKSKLDAAQLKLSAENIARVKRMPKTAYFPQLYVQQPHLYGKVYEGYSRRSASSSPTTAATWTA